MLTSALASFFAAKPPPLCLSPRGRGTASAVDRVLSQTTYLRRSSPLFFIPLVPYPARSARHLPHAGKAVFRGYRFPPPSNLRPFGAPPSIGRRVCPREPLPLEGAAERSEAGLASFLRRSRLLFAFPRGKALCREKRYSRFAAFPIGKRGTPSAVDRVLSYIVDLRRSPPLFFIPLEPYPARFARHLPHTGKALFRGYCFSHPTSAPSGHLLP